MTSMKDGRGGVRGHGRPPNGTTYSCSILKKKHGLKIWTVYEHEKDTQQHDNAHDYTTKTQLLS